MKIISWNVNGLRACITKGFFAGLSTLALGSLLAFAAMVAGSVCALKYQYWRLMREE